MTDETLYSALHWAKKAEYWAGQSAQGQIQADWAQTDNTKKDFIKNKPTIPAAQVNSDWNATTGIAQILNKPTKLSDFTDDTATNPVSRATGDSDGNSIKNTYATKSQLSGEKTNCITEIPQDIKLELNNGTLTLVAGSKVYVPNGSGVFNAVNTSSDQTYSNNFNGTFLVFTTTSSIFIRNISNCFSGAPGTIPTFSGTGAWYDTTNNLIKISSDGGSTWTSGTYSLPIAIITISGGAISSIDQVFNGFGYIGSTVFVLPGVKGLIPNGRNNDGSLKNIEFTTDKVLTYTTSFDYNSDNNFKFAYTNGVLSLTQGYTTYWFEGSLKNIPPKQYAHLLNTDDNDWYFCPNGNAWIIDSIKYCIYTGNCWLDTNGVITSFQPKTAFHALDWNDKSTISGWAMPSDRHIDLTLGASGATYTAPANGWFYFAKIASTSNQYMTMYVDNGDQPIFATTITQPIDGGQARLFLPVKRGDVVGVSYNLAGETRRFCFVYAEGEV